MSIIVLKLLWPTNGTIRARMAISIHIHYSMAIPSLTLIASQNALAMALYKFVQCHCQCTLANYYNNGLILSMLAILVKVNWPSINNSVIPLRNCVGPDQ